MPFSLALAIFVMTSEYLAIKKDKENKKKVRK